MQISPSRPRPASKHLVLLVDDHPIVRQGLTELINRQKHLRVCGEAETGPEALEKMRQLTPDLAIIDITLKNTNGLQLIQELKEQYPRVPLLALSMHDERLYAERVLRAGARGYIMKQEASHKILQAIACVLDGGIFVSETIKKRLLEQVVDGPVKTSVLDRLSNRELEIFQRIGDGFSTRQIARALNLSVKTIEAYRENLKQKLHLQTGSELLQHAIRWNRGNGVME